ncbi:hypothetical protein H8356DRAFT_1364218 [Neocallimastix lanati (nom. inval.)]|nr:hypothetical protein H8356DRAFT_1364218 [Neocallimastix sp. JGI-2020a]
MLIHVCNNNIIIEPKNLHCDFEKDISKAAKTIFPNANIKYCICYLNNLFPTKPSFYELIDKLNELEHLSYCDYQRKIRGIWKIKKRVINKANEISVLIERYKNIEVKLIDVKCDGNNIINL